jgi:hypothetical protein
LTWKDYESLDYSAAQCSTPRSVSRWVGRAAVLFGVVIGAASCASPHSATSSSTTTSAPSTTSRPARTGTTTASVTSPCAIGALQAHAAFGGAAAGSSFYVITVEDKVARPCALDGYPALSFFGPSAAGSGHAGARIVLATTHGGPAPSKVILGPGHPAESLLVFSDNGGSNCPLVGSVQLVPPGSVEPLQLALSFSPCGGGVRVYALGPAGSEQP